MKSSNIVKIWSTPYFQNRIKRNASLLELFYDIILVALLGAIVHKMTGLFISHPNVSTINWREAIYLTFQSVVILLLWRSQTIYSSMFERDDIRHKFFVLLQMLGIAISIVTLYVPFTIVDGVVTSDIEPRKLVVMNMSGFILSLIVQFYLHHSIYRVCDGRYLKISLRQIWESRIFSILICIGISIVSWFLLEKQTNLAWDFSAALMGINIFIWILFGWHAHDNRLSANMVDIDHNLIKERYGILFIVFLAEIFVQVVATTAEHLKNDLSTYISMFIGSVILIFCFWWIYQIYVGMTEIINNPRKFNIFTFGMIIFYVSLLIFAISFSIMLSEPNSDYGKYIAFAAMIVFSFSTPIIISTKKRFSKEHNMYLSNFVLALWKHQFFFFMTWSWLAFVPAITNKIFLMIALIAIICFLMVPILSTRRITQMRSNDKSGLDDIIKKFDDFDKRWTERKIVKHLDIEYHRINKFELNHYSKYALRKSNNLLK